MKKLLLLACLIATPAFAQNPNPPGLSETHVSHRMFKGGSVHEAETDGITDGIVFWKNGTAQAIHNGKLGKWFPARFASEGAPVNSDGGDADAGPGATRHYVAKVPTAQSLGLTTPTASYMAAAMSGMLLRTGPSIIDAYIYISPQQVSAWGGITSATNQAHLAIDSTNESLMHSAVNAQFNLVGVAQYDQNETSGLSSNLNSFATRYSQGAFSALRTATGFDVIALLVTQGDLCGQAYVYSSGMPLAVVNGSSCATANMSYAHEHGHTMGLMHNIGDSGYAAVCGPTAVGYGESRFRTVMSYPSATIDGVSHSYGPRTRQYSAPPPAVWYSDGVSPVGEIRTNAAGCLVITTPVVSSWHASVTTPPPPPQTAPTNVAWTSSTSTLSWTHTRPTTLSFYKVTDNGGSPTNLGVPPVNSYSPYTLTTGSHDLILSACYLDTTCLAAPSITVTVSAPSTNLTYSNLSPADNYVFKATKGKGKSGITFSVTAVDDSGIASVVLNWSAGGTTTASRSGDVFTAKVQSPTRGTRTWYFTITATDGEIVNTTTRTVVVQ
jgi:hypothetical protein